MHLIRARITVSYDNTSPSKMFSYHLSGFESIRRIKCRCHIRVAMNEITMLSRQTFANKLSEEISIVTRKINQKHVLLFLLETLCKELSLCCFT